MLKKLALVACFGATALSSSIASAATVYVTHGIDGRDLALARELPVDIVVGGTCALRGVQYQQTSAAVELPAGSYEVEVRVSDGHCSGALALSGRFDLALGENASVIAHLNQEGAPTLSKFTNDLRTLADEAGRLVVRHTAAAPEVLVSLRQRLTQGLRIRNGVQDGVDAKQGEYVARIADSRTGRLLARAPIKLTQGTVLNVFAVGSLKGGTFAFIVQELSAG
jgi:hypothetical protein